MLVIIAILAGALGGSLVYRLRGGWFSNISRSIGWEWGGKQRTQTMRMIWAVPTSVLMWLASDAPAWTIAPLIVTNFTALALFGTGQYLRDVPARYPDWLGLARNSLAAVPMIALNMGVFFAYAALGSTHALLYWLGFRTPWTSDAGDVFLGALSWAVLVAFILL